MISNSNDLAKQDAKSCRVAITGVAYSGLANQFFIAEDSAQLFFELSKLALKDEVAHIDGSLNEKIGIIFCRANDRADSNVGNESFDVRKLANQLNRPLELLFNGQVANLLQGFEIASEKLNAGLSDVVLLLLSDTNSTAVFILRSLAKALALGKRIHASVALLVALENKDEFALLGTKYQEINLSPKSIDVLAIELQSPMQDLNSQVSQFSKMYLRQLNGISENSTEKNLPHSSPDAWCSLRPVLSFNKHQTNSASLIAEQIVSLQQKILLPIDSEDLMDKADIKKSPFYFNIALRSWFHPQIHAQLRLDHPQPGYTPSLRHAAFHSISEDGAAYHIVFEECEDVNEAKHNSVLADTPSEILTFYGNDREQLLSYLQSVQQYLQQTNIVHSLKNLAFTINKHSASVIDQSLDASGVLQLNGTPKAPIRAAFICLSLEEFSDKLQTLQNRLERNLSLERVIVLNDNQDFYWNEGAPDSPSAFEKIAFVLPGLGAAYPHMLLQLCLHFPEVRAIFDYVDAISISAENPSKPSDRIFPRIDPKTKASRETPASLAVMDSAVITVLMAEWAIFTLLLNLGITPDALLGSSTGEFAALTMSGAVDILKAAPLFYHLSTGMVRALPLDQLIKLRSLKVSAALESIEQDLAEYLGKIYLSANLSPNQLILTGDKDSINTLAKSLDGREITADFLPFAIPYHTPLVSGVVSLSNPDIQNLQITNPLVESWSCSLAAPYPRQVEDIREMTTELFSKPILFRESIEALYAKGIRTFIEVGPRGNLAPVVSETLNKRPHTSLPANRSDIPAITQIQHVLAALFTSGVYMDLGYLYARRSPELLPIETKEANAQPDSQNTNTAAAYLLTQNLVSSGQNSIRRIANSEALQSEIANISNTITLLSQSYQDQLAQLEKQAMSFLSIQSSRSLPMPRNSSALAFLSKEIPLKQMFPNFDDDKCAALVGRQIAMAALPKDDSSLFALANAALAPAELKVFSSFSQLSKRQEWLAGRIAAKESVITLNNRLFGQNANWQTIQIDTLPSGQPYLNSNQLPKHPISITHKNGKSIAVAADASKFKSIGLDLEVIDVAEDIEAIAFTENELKYIAHLSGDQRTYYLKAMWSAKEAAAKALGLGLSQYLTKLAIIDLEPNKPIGISIADQSNNQENEFVLAHTSLLGDMMVNLVVRES